MNPSIGRESHLEDPVKFLDIENSLDNQEPLSKTDTASDASHTEELHHRHL